jgi:glycine hydroxymethyltransferase
MNGSLFAEFVQRGAEILQDEDPALFDLLEQEHQRQADTLVMVASSSIVDPSVLVCGSSIATNVTAEGYPGARFHAGCEVVDQIEQLAIDRAKAAFQAQYANVQPHSASTANEIVMFSMLKPGDTILGMQLDSGGHLTHGAKVSISGKVFNAIGYGLDEAGQIDYEQVRRLAHESRPRLMICGTTAYPRVIDFARFRAIADEVGALLLADITHIAGLVVAGLHPSPIEHAHFTTTCTHKQLYGPRGGLILMGREHETLMPGGKITLAQAIQKSVFPLCQGAPILNSIAAKARALDMVMRPDFKALATRIVANSRALARSCADKGYDVVSGGSDNHIVLVDVLRSAQVTGIIAQRALEECGIIVNKNRVPGDQKSVLVTSGIRLGTNSLARRALGEPEMAECAQLIDQVLRQVTMHSDHEYTLPATTKASVREGVIDLCRRFPIPRYPSLSLTHSF